MDWVQDWTEDFSSGTPSFSTWVPLQSRYRDDLVLALDVSLFDLFPGLPEDEAFLAKKTIFVNAGSEVRCSGIGT